MLIPSKNLKYNFIFGKKYFFIEIIIKIFTKKFIEIVFLYFLKDKETKIKLNCSFCLTLTVNQ